MVLFLTFDNFNLTFCSSNITRDYSFVTFGGSFFFFFFQIWWFYCHIRQYSIAFDCTFVIFNDTFFFFFFFLIFDSSIITLDSPNITSNCTFVTFGSILFFFSHLTVPSLHWAAPISHMTVLLYLGLLLKSLFYLLITLITIEFKKKKKNKL